MLYHLQEKNRLSMFAHGREVLQLSLQDVPLCLAVVARDEAPIVAQSWGQYQEVV
jgi:hypothetical protein